MYVVFYIISNDNINDDNQRERQNCFLIQVVELE